MQDLNDKVNNGGATAAGKLANTEWNEVASEVQSVIEGMGITLSGIALNQLMKAVVAGAGGKASWFTDNGTGTWYNLTQSTVGMFTVGLFDGMEIRFRPNTDNAITNPTLQVFAFTKVIISESGGAIGIGDLSTTRDATVRYDGSAWRLLDRATALRPVGTYPPGHIIGYRLENYIPDVANRIVVNRGKCVDSTEIMNLDIASNYVKRFDATWVLGGGGGFPTSALTRTQNTWYRVFIIGGSSATTDIGFDTSPGATNVRNEAFLVTGNTYDKFRQIGWIYNGSGNVLARFNTMEADPYTVRWDIPMLIANSAVAATRVSYLALAPPDSVGIISATFKEILTTIDDNYLILSALSSANTVPSIISHQLMFHGQGGNTHSNGAIIDVGLNSAGIFGARSAVSSSNQNLIMITVGYRYRP